MALDNLRKNIRDVSLQEEAVSMQRLMSAAELSPQLRKTISDKAEQLVSVVRAKTSPSIMESFLAEYGLSTSEGIALMCLAEALLRVPDTHMIDALIEDKIAPGEWSAHLGRASSSLVNASSWALMFTGKVVAPQSDEGLAGVLRNVIKKLGEPLVRTAVAQAMKELGKHFVLGQTIEEAISHGVDYARKGYTYSYDMLGEAACTQKDALRYYEAYAGAIRQLSAHCQPGKLHQNPGISIKLSALHPRYEHNQKHRLFEELVPRCVALARLAKEADMGLNIDAEEADRLDLSLDIIQAILSHEELAGWDGFGVVVQAFGPRAAYVLDWLYALAEGLDRKIMVRLVKGAYWDSEIKRAQTLGLSGFPVFTRKVNTDISYLANVQKLLTMTDRIYPQFASHNAHSLTAVLELARAKRKGIEGKDIAGKDINAGDFEFQRLHGMGEALHETIRETVGLGVNNIEGAEKVRCRIYAPVGSHRELLAYLVRRLLENGANSSFVHQLSNADIAPDIIAADPFCAYDDTRAGEVIEAHHPAIQKPAELFAPVRRNSKGWDLTDPNDILHIEQARAAYKNHIWHFGPILSGPNNEGEREIQNITNPAHKESRIGTMAQASLADVEQAFIAAKTGFASWSQRPIEQRAAIIRRIGDVFEEHFGELFALASLEAGKNMADCVAELREAVDFTQYYAAQLLEQSHQEKVLEARGIIACISPWNFPLAIFTGQICAALAAGNAVLAKPAEQTPCMAARAVMLMHEAGVPKDALQLLPGEGHVIGAAIVNHSDIAGVCFTGSIETAQHISKNIASSAAPTAPLIAETGGMNAMIVDSTALPEQVVRDVVASAFQSAGQRCSALRILYLQEDVAPQILDMLYGALDVLNIADPWHITTDIGPLIDAQAHQKISAYCAELTQKGQLLKKGECPQGGYFLSPHIFKVSGIEELEEEIFGPVLHVATYKGDDFERVIEAVNSKGYGLTFGLHSRIDARVAYCAENVEVGNLYVNRNQIGAIVGSQPFGGEGLSGTGPKAGGPYYLPRFFKQKQINHSAGRAENGQNCEQYAENINIAELEQAFSTSLEPEWERHGFEEKYVICKKIFSQLPWAMPQEPVGLSAALDLPGPTGELNRLSRHPRGSVLCLGPNIQDALRQSFQALICGNLAIICPQQRLAPQESEKIKPFLRAAQQMHCPAKLISGHLEPELLAELKHISAICSYADDTKLCAIRLALSRRSGPLIPLLTSPGDWRMLLHERHLCVDTTASGGNAHLLTMTRADND